MTEHVIEESVPSLAERDLQDGNSPDWTREPPAFYIDGSWPKSIQPAFIDVSRLPGTKILEDNYEAIRDEIVAHYGERPEDFKPNFTPYAYREEGWRTVNLCSYFLEYPEACRKFPVVNRVVRQIPGMCMAQIAVLAPRTRIKAHFGDTNCTIRSHLGIVVPGDLPDIGIRVQREDRAWKEGEVWALSIAHRHFAWNDTDRYRIVLVVDVIRPELAHRRYELASKALATIAMKYFATKFPRLKRLPRGVTLTIHACASLFFRARLLAQRSLGF
jgi:hypothetical protein